MARSFSVAALLLLSLSLALMLAGVPWYGVRDVGSDRPILSGGR